MRPTHGAIGCHQQASNGGELWTSVLLGADDGLVANIFMGGNQVMRGLKLMHNESF